MSAHIFRRIFFGLKILINELFWMNVYNLEKTFSFFFPCSAAHLLRQNPNYNKSVTRQKCQTRDVKNVCGRVAFRFGRKILENSSKYLAANSPKGHQFVHIVPVLPIYKRIRCGEITIFLRRAKV